jgi:hypothetical protein
MTGYAGCHSFICGVVRCAGGAVMFADRSLPPAGDDDTWPLRRLAPEFGAILHDADPRDAGILEQVSGALGCSLTTQSLLAGLPKACAEAAAHGAFGVLVAGVDREQPAPITIVGVHQQRGFSPLRFLRNSYGGNSSVVARYLDKQLWTPAPNLGAAKELSAFLLSESRLAEPMPAGDYAVFASVTCEDGFAFVGQGEVELLLTRARDRSARLKARCTHLLLPSRPLTSLSLTEERS